MLLCLSTAGADYNGPSPLMLTFSSGQFSGAQRCTSVLVLDDSLIEEDEFFNVSLHVSPSDSSAVRFTGGIQTTTVTIVQDPNDGVSIR